MISYILLAVLLSHQPNAATCWYTLEGTTIILPRRVGDACAPTVVFNLDPRE